METTNIYVTRHGQTEWNVQGRMQGHLDSPLTKLGEWQASCLRDALSNVESLIRGKWPRELYLLSS